MFLSPRKPGLVEPRWNAKGPNHHPQSHSQNAWLLRLTLSAFLSGHSLSSWLRWLLFSSAFFGPGLLLRKLKGERRVQPRRFRYWPICRRGAIVGRQPDSTSIAGSTTGQLLNEVFPIYPVCISGMMGLFWYCRLTGCIAEVLADKYPEAYESDNNRTADIYLRDEPVESESAQTSTYNPPRRKMATTPAFLLFDIWSFNTPDTGKARIMTSRAALQPCIICAAFIVLMQWPGMSSLYQALRIGLHWKAKTKLLAKSHISTKTPTPSIHLCKEPTQNIFL